MKALCMITVKPGMVDKVVQILRKKRENFKRHNGGYRKGRHIRYFEFINR